MCENDHFGRFCDSNGKTLQQFIIRKPDEVYHQSRTAIRQLSALAVASTCLYSRHIMTSALHHRQQKNIFNLPPYFAEIFRIKISSATTGKNFVQINYHLSKL